MCRCILYCLMMPNNPPLPTKLFLQDYLGATCLSLFCFSWLDNISNNFSFCLMEITKPGPLIWFHSMFILGLTLHLQLIKKASLRLWFIEFNLQAYPPLYFISTLWLFMGMCFAQVSPETRKNWLHGWATHTAVYIILKSKHYIPLKDWKISRKIRFSSSFSFEL